MMSCNRSIAEAYLRYDFLFYVTSRVGFGYDIRLIVIGLPSHKQGFLWVDHGLLPPGYARYIPERLLGN